MNEILRRALLSAGLDEVDVAARLDVDPKTVRRWLEGRLPYARHRWALATLLQLDEIDLWPDLRTARNGRLRPEELRAIYPNRSVIPQETWRTLFASAEYEICILDYSSFFLAEDCVIRRTFADKAKANVKIRIALSDPIRTRAVQSGLSESIEETMATRLHDALTLYRSLDEAGVQIRIHSAVLYNSIYRSDADLLVNQHLYGISTEQSPVLHFQQQPDGNMVASYLNSFERIWNAASSAH